MHDINRIKDLLAQQEALVDRYEELDAVLDDLTTLRRDQEFIPADLNSSICGLLSKINKSQNAFLKDYEALEFGETPASVKECKDELDDYLTYIVEKSSYVEIVNFMLNLDSDNPPAKSALEQHQQIVSEYDCRSHSVEECEAELKKYDLLRKAFEEKDPTARLTNIIELSPMIDFPLVVALNTNALYLKNTEPAEAETPVAAPASPVTENIPEEPAIEPVQEERIAAPAEFETPKKPAMPEFDFTSERFFGRPAPDEKPIKPENIELGLTSELNHVLSRETVAASLATNVLTTAEAPKPAPASEATDNLAAWKNLGIHNPSVACYSVSDNDMQIYRCERPKKFSPADFLKEMALKSPNRFQKQYAMRDAYKYGATTPHILSDLIQEDLDLVEDACDTLVDSGYLKAFELDGTRFRDFDRLYVLTASGRRVFTNPETAATLNMTAVEKAATPPFSSHANSVLTRQLFLHSKKLMEKRIPSREYGVGSFILETNSFINFFPTTNNSGTFAYVGAFGKELKDYLIFKVELQEMLPSFNSITVVGMTRENAKAIADWICDSFEDSLSGKFLQFYAYDTDTYYSYPEGTAIDFNK